MADPQYDVPEDYKSGLKDVLKEAKEIYEQKKGLGYQTYAGPQIAGFSPDELAAMQGIAGLVGAGQQYFAPSAALTLGQTQQFTPQMAAQYMSPYQQAVVDVEKREAVRQAQVPMQQARAKAVGAGGYGGSRQAILEAEQQRNLMQQLGDIQTKGSQSAYETGLRAFEAQKERERAAASGLAALGQAVPKQALTELTALSGIGEAQRGMTQAGLDIARQEFEQQQQYPYTTLGQYQSTLYGYPYQSTARYQPYQQSSSPSSAQNLAGILGAVGKVGSSFGFFNTGGRVAYQSEGGLSGMIKELAEGGTASSGASPLDTIMNAIANLQTTREKTMLEQQRLAEEKEARLQKQMSPVSAISDLLIGYAASDPDAGLGVQLAGAAEYMAEQRQSAIDAAEKIKQDLADGKIDQATADLEIAKLGYEYSLPPSIKFPSDTEMRATAEGYLNTVAEAKTTKGTQRINQAIINAKRRMREEAAANPETYRDRPSAQEIRINELIAEEMTGKTSDSESVVDTTSVSGNVSTDETAQQPATPLTQQIDAL